MRRSIRVFSWAMLLCLIVSAGSCVKGEAQSTSPTAASRDEAVKVTFIELGSVSCVPCRAMQPIMEELERRYPADLEVLFYDVWTEQGKPYAAKYRIRVIPTQIFLDSSGKEYFRHEGFFPLEELEKVLHEQGVSR